MQTNSKKTRQTKTRKLEKKLEKNYRELYYRPTILCIGNESVPKMIINDTVKFLS